MCSEDCSTLLAVQSSGIVASPAAPLAHRIGATSLNKSIFSWGNEYLQSSDPQ